MLIIITIIAVLLVSGFIIKYYPKSKNQPIAVEEQPTWNFDKPWTYEIPTEDLAPEATPEPSIVAAINETITKVKSKKKPAKNGSLVKMEAKKKPTKKTNKK